MVADQVKFTVSRDSLQHELRVPARVTSSHFGGSKKFGAPNQGTDEEPVALLLVLERRPSLASRQEKEQFSSSRLPLTSVGTRVGVGIRASVVTRRWLSRVLQGC